MQVTQIVYTKTVQEKDYEPEMMEATANLEEGEDFEEAAKELRAKVRGVLGIGGSTSTTKKKTSKAETEELPELPEEVEEEAPAAKKTTKKTTKKTAKKTTAKKTAPKKKPVAYDREVKDHKTKLGEILTENFPDWKKSDEMKRLAKQASTDLEGEDFLDGNTGEVLESFVETVISAMESGSSDEL